MTKNNDDKVSIPGISLHKTKKRMSTVMIAERCIREWESNRLSVARESKHQARINNCICISRKIGVGALEIADLVGEKTGLHVIDREIIEYIADNAELRQSTVENFDERHPGVMSNIGALASGEKSFSMDEYLRYLISTVYALADDGPTIFVGRGTHLILPRERVLAIRIISSREHRIRRVAELLEISNGSAEKKIAAEDRMQTDFFKANFRKTSAPPTEFDLIINRDYFSRATWAADMIVEAYKLKFGGW